MKPYFEKMKEFGQALKEGQIKSTAASAKQIQEVEAQVAEAVDHRVQLAVFPVPGEFCEVLVQHVVERVVGRIHFVNQIAALDQDARVLGIGVNDVERAGRGL